MVWHAHPKALSPTSKDETTPHAPSLHPNDNVGKALALMDKTEMDPYPISHPERPRKSSGNCLTKKL